MKNLILLIASAGLLAACGAPFCRQNMCASCGNEPVQARPAQKPAPAPKAEPQPEPEPVPVIDTSKTFTMGATAFKYNAFDFTEEAEESLIALAAYMKANPSVKITVSGHTDSVGNAKSNQWLSEQRANAVKKFLVGKGIKADRIKTVGYGKDKPVASNATKEGRAKNRRVEIEFSK